MDQTAECFLRVETIVIEALAAPDQLRAELIEARCEGDALLSGEVRSLLAACEAEEHLMESCRREQVFARNQRPERKRVGPYEIDRLLGRGGMGAVYLAHRVDGHFEQKVAVKLIEQPLATELFRERFRQERQILAGLQHPYIARLLDGGVSAEGELYLVMEYIEGAPIHRFCEERHLTQEQRIALYLRVCEAVQFAHQNFIVHRDLKSDNILVVEDGTPRLLDFGTAKLLSPSLGNPASQLTREGYLSFTPQYASPEQVLGNPITTASDTYSLGVLLYLLLTGLPPYEMKELTTAEMLRAVCEEAPRKPLPAADSGKRFDADLEAILMKALRKEPQERYLTAERLADDLRAFLERRPVAARQGTLRYRAGKLVRRHRWGLSVATALVVTLIAGITGVVWQARVADEERHKAVARSADLRQLSNSLLSELDDAIQQLPGSTSAQKLLVTRVLEHLDRMAGDAYGDRQTQLDLADAYTKLGNLQGNAYVQNLGDTTGAIASIDKAIALSTPWAGHNSDDPEALGVLANAQMSRGQILFGAAPIEQTIASTQAAIATYSRLIDLPGVTPGVLCDAARPYSVLGDAFGTARDQSLNHLPEAVFAYRRYLDLNSRALTMDPSLMRARQGLAVGQVKIAETEMELDPAQALKDTQTGFERIAALPKAAQESLQMLRVRNVLLLNRAVALVQLGQYSVAFPLEAQLVESSQHLAMADPDDLRALYDLQTDLQRQAEGFETAADSALGASELDRQRNLTSEEKPLALEIANWEKLQKQDRFQEEWKPFLADAQVRLGSIQSILHHGGNSIGMVRMGLDVFRDLAQKDENSPEILDLAAQGLLFAEPASLKNPQLAVEFSERAVSLSHRKSPSKLLTLAQAYRAAGQSEKSLSAAKEGLALLPAPQLGNVTPRTRKLLEILEQRQF